MLLLEEKRKERKRSEEEALSFRPRGELSDKSEKLTLPSIETGKNTKSPSHYYSFKPKIALHIPRGAIRLSQYQLPRPALQQVLSNCQQLSVSNKSIRDAIIERTERQIDLLQTRFITNPRLATERIGSQVRSQIMKDMQSEQCMTVENLSEDIKNLEKKKSNKFSALDRVDFDLRNRRVDPDGLEQLLQYKKFPEKSRNFDKEKEELENRYEHFSKDVNRYMSEVKNLKTIAASLGENVYKDKEIEHEFCRAIHNCDEDMARKILDCHPNLIRCSFSLKETPLILACKVSSERMVALLLSRGSDLDAKDFLGRTSLEIAERHNRKRILQLLNFWKMHKSIPSYL
eukprot:TRINITY_DN1783_c0_g1_i2.p1 TRINITY_DN1783_c0_g1~~TRINITY_DN1783_c0_g1_i2.p1  ORF type:complete len:345 (+),score=54.46 TRINITY_DN1783_c0_g1_i2:382-1416(+)